MLLQSVYIPNLLELEAPSGNLFNVSTNRGLSGISTDQKDTIMAGVEEPEAGPGVLFGWLNSEEEKKAG